MTEKVFQMKDGTWVTAEDVVLLYSEVGLKTGFVNTEFGHAFPLSGLRDGPIGGAAGNFNDGLRDLSGIREDFFRMGHFIDRMKRSNAKDLHQAAKESAYFVRKYHFDYTDFTPFEKQFMIRAIPFYKFTRRNLPLMLETLFTKPGKAMMYPKAMNNISMAFGEGDPNSEALNASADTVLPTWVQNRMMWPTGRSELGNTVYADIATPFNDAFKFMGDPTGNTLGMATPAFKIPVEMLRGETLQSDIPTGSALDYVVRQTPLSNMIAQNAQSNARGENDGIISALDDPKTLAYLTGVGLFENTPRQQEGALIERTTAANAALPDPDQAEQLAEEERARALLAYFQGR
jgi:hypothetical protein